MALKPPISPRLEDDDAEAVRRGHHDAIVELQRSPLAGCKVVSSVVLADGVDTTVAHGLGRVPIVVLLSPVRGAISTGRIVESRPASLDRSQSVILTASGYGATVTVDMVAG